MINLFRKIRKSLFAEKKFSEYFFYAIGEILLVVLGILIALQIDGWAENKRNQQKLYKSLIALHDDLVKDSLAINGEWEYSNKEFIHDSLLWIKLELPTTNYDTLVNIFNNEFRPWYVARINYSKSAYLSMISNGSIELLEDSVRNSIRNYYTFLDYRENINGMLNNQYQQRYQTFNQEISSGPFTKLSPYLQRLIWDEMDKSSFTNQFIGLLGARHVLWWSYRREMQLVLQQTRIQLELLNSYIEMN